MIPILVTLLVFLIMLLLISYILFRIVFYVPSVRKQNFSEIQLPPGEEYEPYWELIRNWIIECRQMPHEVFTIESHDGLTLHGTYYEYAPGAPIELMFHGYRGNAERDLSGGVFRCFQLGHSALIVDQRCSGNSEGNVITFGIHEHQDCINWILFIIRHFGSDVKIILTGISMGASTVLMAAGQDLPDNVIGVLADCGFHSAKEIIISVASNMGLPAKILYPFVRFGAKLYGRFDLEMLTALDAVSKCKIPVLFFHGEADHYVPSYMSQRNFDACSSRKKIVLIPGAGHGLCFPVSPDQYIREMKDFFYGEK